jgi:hypothetical protein
LAEFSLSNGVFNVANAIFGDCQILLLLKKAFLRIYPTFSATEKVVIFGPLLWQTLAEFRR